MPVSFIQANTNGRLHDAREPSITPLNRGFLYGDAIYEVWRTYHGVIFAWDEHWQRLGRSAEALHIALPFDAGAILAEIRRTVAEYRKAGASGGELYIRLQITRGDGAIGLDTGLADGTDFVILVQPCPQLSEEKQAAGLRLSVATSVRRNPVESLSPAWKTGNYLNNVLALREARGRGADEVVILNLAGEITEAAVSNLGFVRDGVVLTPPLSAGILSGVTRGFLFDPVAAMAGVKIVEQILGPADLGALDECFLLSSTKDVTPVAEIDGARFRVDADTVTARLKRAFAEYARAYADRHPELKA